MNIENIIALSSGMTRELYDHISEITLPVPEFRLATPLMIQAAIYQSAFLWNDDDFPSLGMVLSGSSSLTKSTFLKVARTYLQAATPNHLASIQSPISPKPASDVAFHKALASRPTVITIDDEWGLKMEGAYLRGNEKDHLYIQ